MKNSILQAPTVGSLVKKILNINPELNSQEIIDIIRNSAHNEGRLPGDFSSSERIDEAKALRLARATAQSPG